MTCGGIGVPTTQRAAPACAATKAPGLVNKALRADTLSAHVSEVERMTSRSIAVMKRQSRAWHFQSFTAPFATAAAETGRSFAAPDFNERVGSLVDRRTPAFAGV